MEDELTTQVKAAILSQDQLAFVYDKDDGTQAVRLVTPVEFKDGDNVLCIQHLPEEGWRQFNLEKMSSLRRVMARMVVTVPSQG